MFGDQGGMPGIGGAVVAMQADDHAVLLAQLVKHRQEL